MTTKQEEGLKKALKRANELEYLECRRGASGHHWVRVVPDFGTHVSDFALMWECRTCETIKRAACNRYGEYVMRPSYQYCEGYMAQPDEDGRVGFAPSEIRAALARKEVVPPRRHD